MCTHSNDINEDKSNFLFDPPDHQNVTFGRIENERRLASLSRHNAEKRFAIHLLGVKIIQILKDIQDQIYFEEDCVPISDSVVSHFFSWSFQNFMTRRRESNLLELLVMSRLPSEFLEKKKQYHDIEQLIALLTSILQPYFNGVKLEGGMKMLQDGLDLETAYPTLQNELIASSKKFFSVSGTFSAGLNFMIKVPPEMLSGQELSDEIYYSIEQRYVAGYTRDEIESAEDKYGGEEKTLEQKLAFYKKKIVNEGLVHFHTMMAYDIQNSSYHSNLAKWDTLYNTDFDVHDSKNEYLKKLIEKQKATRALLEKTTIEHRENLAAMRIAEEEARLRQIAYLTQLEKEEEERKMLEKQKRREKRRAKLKALRARALGVSGRSYVKESVETLAPEKPKDIKSRAKEPTAKISQEQNLSKDSKVEIVDSTNMEIKKSQETNVEKLEEEKLEIIKSQETESNERTSLKILASEQSKDIKSRSREKRPRLSQGHKAIGRKSVDRDRKRKDKEKLRKGSEVEAVESTNIDIKKSQETNVEKLEEEKLKIIKSQETESNERTSLKILAPEQPKDIKSRSREKTARLSQGQKAIGRKSVDRDRKRKDKEKLRKGSAVEAVESTNMDIKKSQETNVEQLEEEKLEIIKSQETELNERKSIEEKLEVSKLQVVDLDVRTSQEANLDVKKSQEVNLDERKSQEKILEIEINEANTAEKSKAHTRKITAARLRKKVQELTKKPVITKKMTTKISEAPNKSATPTKSATAKKSATPQKSVASKKFAQKQTEVEKSIPQGQNNEKRVSEKINLEKLVQDDDDFEGQGIQDPALENQVPIDRDS